MRRTQLVALVLFVPTVAVAQWAKLEPLPRRPAPAPAPAPPVAPRPAPPAPNPALTDPSFLQWKRAMSDALAREQAERLKAERERAEREQAERVVEPIRVTNPAPAQTNPCPDEDGDVCVRQPRYGREPEKAANVVDAGVVAPPVRVDLPPATIYHWVDAQGVEHYSDEPGPKAR